MVVSVVCCRKKCIRSKIEMEEGRGGLIVWS